MFNILFLHIIFKILVLHIEFYIHLHSIYCFYRGFRTVPLPSYENVLRIRCELITL